MLDRFKKFTTRLAIIAVLIGGGVVVPASTASAATVSNYSCHHGYRSLGFLYEEFFVSHYRVWQPGNDAHMHRIRHIDPVGRTHYHVKKCGTYYRDSKLIHYYSK